MKTVCFFVALWGALFCAAAPVQAQSSLPPCWPKQLGSTGSDFKRGATPEGQWAAWTCTARGRVTTYGVWAVSGYELTHPDVAGMTPIQAARAYWAANVTNPSDPRLARLRAAAAAAFAQ